MRTLMTGVTTNTTGDWVAFEVGPDATEVVLQFSGLDGATCAVQISYDGGTTISQVYSTTSDELRAAQVTGDQPGAPSSQRVTFHLRAVLSDAQAGTDAKVGVT